MRAIQISELGGPDVLHEVELPVPEPGHAQVLTEVPRAGRDFADTRAHRDRAARRTTGKLLLDPCA